MSADNGIYILKTKDSYRVTHAQAIENLFFSYVSNATNEIVPTRAVEIFGNCKFTRDEAKALKIAHQMEKNTYTEYGVKIYSTPKSWKQIVMEAKELAKKEIEILQKEKPNLGRDYHIERLEEVLRKYETA